MQGIIWEPYGDYLEKSNVRLFMNKHGIKDYDDLIKRSINDIRWFWNAMMDDCRVEWSGIENMTGFWTWESPKALSGRGGSWAER